MLFDGLLYNNNNSNISQKHLFQHNTRAGGQNLMLECFRCSMQHKIIMYNKMKKKMNRCHLVIVNKMQLIRHQEGHWEFMLVTGCRISMLTMFDLCSHVYVTMFFLLLLLLILLYLMKYNPEIFNVTT